MERLRAYGSVTLLAVVVALLGMMALSVTAISTDTGVESMNLQTVPSRTPTPAPNYLPVVLKPEPTPTTAPPEVPGWLSYANQFRALAGLPLLSENAAWSAGGVLHSRYMVKEDLITHYEASTSPWYTPEGDAAGRNGNIYVSSATSSSDEAAINYWMSAPFHGVSMIDPELSVIGFGSYREAVGTWKMGATLDVSRGHGSLPGGVSFPIMYPKDEGSLWLTQFYGNEWPDPLSSCPGYTAPTGPAIILQMGTGSVNPQVSGSRFSGPGGDLEHCVLDENSYVNPGDAGQQSTGRVILGMRDAVVILPRQPLTPGQRYEASITVNGTAYTWQFQVVSPAAGMGQPERLPGDVEIR